MAAEVQINKCDFLVFIYDSEKISHLYPHHVSDPRDGKGTLEYRRCRAMLDLSDDGCLSTNVYDTRSWNLK